MGEFIHPTARTHCVDAIDALRYAAKCLPKIKSPSEPLQQCGRRRSRRRTIKQDAVSSLSALEAAAEQIEACFGDEKFNIIIHPVGGLLGDELHKELIDDLKNLYNVSY